MESPRETYLKHLDCNELAPGDGNTALSWRISRGEGTVYASTVVHYRDEAPLNIALIDMDEGFRLMSRVEDIDAAEVRIGMRVSLRVLPADGSRPACPVFTPVLP